MKNIVEFLHDRGYIFKKLHKIDNQLLNTKKKIEVYEAIDLKSNYVAIFYVLSKSRFIVKNTQEIFSLYEKLIKTREHNFKKRVLILNSLICSKSKILLKENKWKIYVTL